MEMDDSKMEGEGDTPVGLGAPGMGISVFTSPLHRFEYHSPSPSRERLLRAPRDVEGGFVSDEADSEDSEDERDQEAHEILMPEGDGPRTSRSNSGTLSANISRNSSDADLRALDAMSATHAAASVALLDRVSSYRDRQSHAHRQLELGIAGRGLASSTGMKTGEDADDEMSPILPSPTPKPPPGNSTSAGHDSGNDRAGGNIQRGYGSTD
jgi:hypothetical protein